MVFAIVPAYNEEKAIGSVVRNLFMHVDTVVVVDDGSTDATAREALLAGAVVLRHAVNRGQGAALETGHEYARRTNAAIVIHFDADGQFDPADIPGALHTMEAEQADIVFGSRFLDARSNMPMLKRHILFPVARLVDRLAGAVPLSDAHNGFRILNRRALGAIRITQDHMAHATEIPVLARQAKFRVAEYPVAVHYARYGQGIRGGMRIIKELFFGRFIG
jgi:glycosyltransferase involved in cell wall biosynthesis